MSSLLALLRQLAKAVFMTPRAVADPETMPLRDWADLPVHHPLCDRAPC